MTTKRKFIVVAGPKGSGKSTQIQIACPRSLTIKSAPNVLSHFEGERVLHPEHVGPASEALLSAYQAKLWNGKEYDAGEDEKGNRRKLDTHTWLEKMANGILKNLRDKKLDIEWVILDEAGEQWDRMLLALPRSSTDENAHYTRLKSITIDIIDLFMEVMNYDVGLVLATHDMPSSYDKKRNKLKKEGARFGSPASAEIICGKADACILRGVDDIYPRINLGEGEWSVDKTKPPRTEYYWYVQPGTGSMTKLRGCPIAELPAVRNMELDEIVQRYCIDPSLRTMTLGALRYPETRDDVLYVPRDPELVAPGASSTLPPGEDAFG